MKAKYKLNFPQYDTYGSSVKSLLNFIVTYGKVWHYLVSDWDWSTRKTYTVTSTVAKDGNKYKFQLPSEVEYSIAIVNGTMSTDRNHTNKIDNEIFFIDSNKQITITADRNDYYKYNISVTAVKPFLYSTSALRLENFSYTSGYDMFVITQTDEAIAKYKRLKTAYGNLSAPGVYFTSDGDATKMVFSKVSESDNYLYVYVELYNNDNKRIAHSQESGFPIIKRTEECYDGYYGFSLSNANKTWQLFPEDGSSKKSLVSGFSVKFHNYNSLNGIGLLDFSNTDTIELVTLPETEIPVPSICSLFSGFRAYQMLSTFSGMLGLYKTLLDNTLRCVEESDVAYIPITLTLVPDKQEHSSLPSDFTPYSKAYSDSSISDESDEDYTYSKYSLDFENTPGNITYQLKTDTFTIIDTYSSNIDKYNCYYKIGIVANDLTDDSSSELANEFMNKCYFTFCQDPVYEWKDVYADEDLSIFNSNPAIKSKDPFAETFYSVSEILIRNTISEIKMKELKNETYNSTPATNPADPGVVSLAPNRAILPIIEVDNSIYSNPTDHHRLKGLMYMQLFNADTNTPIEDSFIVTREHHNMRVEHNFSDGTSESAILADLRILQL